MLEAKSVALHFGLHTFHRLEIARGVVKYAREHGNWRLFGGFYTSQPVMDFTHWEGDGIITIAHSGREARSVLATGLPVVGVVEGFKDKRIVYVTCDNREAGRRAAEHLIGNGFSRFAVCGIKGIRWSRLRGNGFVEALGQPSKTIPRFERGLAWWQNPGRSKALEKFLAALPPYTGVLAENDTAGVKVTTACHFCNRSVPDDIAVVGIDGDSLLCDLSSPALSTVPINGMRIGSEAAERLDELMNRKNASRQPRLIPPGNVTVRASSDTAACEDAMIRNAITFIRQNFTRPLSVPDVARHVAACRRTLEMRFRQHLGRTVLEEIRANRMRMALRLLEETQIPITDLILKCGFPTHQFFYQIFNRELGITPAQYREKYRRNAIDTE